MLLQHKVSVITPSYCQGQYLEETIISVLNQTYKNIEYIVIDGGSTDDSLHIIKKYEDRIKYWISEKDEGQADAINKGFAKAEGDYVCWINSDDILYPDFIERRVREFNQNPDCDLIYGDVDQGVDRNRAFLRKGRQTDYADIVRTCNIPIPQQSAMWRKSVFQTIGGLNVSLHVLLDFDYFFRISKHFKIKYIPGAVAFFRNHPNSKSVAQIDKWISELDDYIDFSHKTEIVSSADFRRFKFSVNKWQYLLSKEIANYDYQRKYSKELSRNSVIHWVFFILKNKIIRLLVAIKRIVK